MREAGEEDTCRDVEESRLVVKRLVQWKLLSNNPMYVYIHYRQSKVGLADAEMRRDEREKQENTVMYVKSSWK
jgi:hypothetical protein